jgi:hydroxymethylglutaryl-CoA reductase
MNWKKEEQKMQYSSSETGQGNSSENHDESTKVKSKKISGFSKLSKEEKLNLISELFLAGEIKDLNMLKSFWHKDEQTQKVIDEFSENTLSNFALPFGVCPNVLINDEIKCIPMVIEESSVVAAAAKASKFWMSRGGFKAEVISQTKIGQVHLIFKGEGHQIQKAFLENSEALNKHVAPLMKNMEQRGGGLLKLELRDLSDKEDHYYQLWAEFNTCDAMGANFINSVLEELGKKFELILSGLDGVGEEDVQIVMAILSNYTPDCTVKAWVECSLEELYEKDLGMSAQEFAAKFSRSVRIATIDVNRATTHNKGIMNGIDSVILATGNDFRAVEAAAHTYAARDGQYRSLSKCTIEEGRFRFEIELPMAIGTVGGLTALHPLAKLSLKLLGNPKADELMQACAVIGLAQNFAALKSLVTTGIQKGHMKMHLMNILNHLEANKDEREKVSAHFEDEVISFTAIRDYLNGLRQYQ